MSEFASATPIGAVKIIVEADLSKYRQQVQEELKKGQQGVGNASFVPSSPFKPGPSLGGGGGNRYPFGWQMGPTGYGGVAAGQGPNVTPGWAGWNMGPNTGGLSPQFSPGAGWAFPATAAGGRGGGGPRQTGNHHIVPGPRIKKPKKPRGGHGGGAGLGRHLTTMGIIYTIMRLDEAFAGLGTAAINAGRNMNAAWNNAGRVQAQAQMYNQGLEAVRQVPIIGGAAAANFNFMATTLGVDPESIQRQLDETATAQGARDAGYRGFFSARTRTGTANAGMFPNTSYALEQEATRRKYQAERAGFGDQRQAISDKYQEDTQSSDLPGFIDPTGGFSYLRNSKREAKNADIRSARASEMSGVNAAQKASDLNEKADQERLKFAQDGLQLQLKNREQVADLTSKWWFVSADVTKRWAEYQETLRQTPEELKKQFRSTSLSEAQAQLKTEYAEIGRKEATEVDVSRTIVGDPSGIRHLTDPLEAIRQHIANIATGTPRLLLGH